MKSLFTFFVFVTFWFNSFGQVGISETNASPDNSAMLDVKSINKGILIPRMTSAQMNNINNPAQSLIVFNTDDNSFYFRNNSAWQKLLSEMNNYKITDFDGDSYLTMRYSETDDDTLRIFFNGIEKYKISSASIEPVNNGNSVYMGKDSGKKDDGNDNANTGIGFNSMAKLVSGNQNTSIGINSLNELKSGDLNVGVGGFSMNSNRAKNRNTAVGYGAMMFADSNSVNFDSYNTGIGTHALRGSLNPANNTGIYNTAVGGRAMNENTSGSGNCAFGFHSMFTNSTGYSNIAIGIKSLYSNTGKNNLIAIGDSALYNNGIGSSSSLSASSNIAIGSKSLYSNTIGYRNTALGPYSLYSNIDGDNNSSFGYFSLYKNTTGDYNTAVGSGALYYNKAISRNTAIGYNSLFNADSMSTSPAYNTAIGVEAMKGSNDPGTNTGKYNTGVGDQALYSFTNGNYNTAVGRGSLKENTSGNRNCAIGMDALFFNKSKNSSTAIGFQAMYFADNTTSGGEANNTAVGVEALKGSNSASSNTGTFNTAIGERSMFSNSTGSYNAALGNQSLYMNTTGNSNTAIGSWALRTNASGALNTVVGSEAMYKSITAHNNTVLGWRAGYEVIDGGNNLILGYNAGKNITSGNNNIVIGYDLEVPSASSDNQMVIGAQDLLFGNIANKRIGIGTTEPAAILHTHGIGTGGGNVLFTGLRKISGAGDPPVSGAGTRMMWYPDQAAFRAGQVESTQWDKTNLGTYSVAMGLNTKATFTSCVAIGYSTTASNDFATALGVYTNATGHSSTALGSYTTAPSYVETVIGQYNTSYTPWNVNNWNALDRLFVIGNGTDNSSRSNAIVVLKNGNVGIGVDSPLEQLHTTGSIRFSGLSGGTGTQAVMIDAIGNLSKRTLNNVAFNGFSENDPTWTGNENITDKISRTGNIGIGASATNPSYKVSIGYNGVGIDSPSDNTLTLNTSSIERMCIYNGNVGIGCFYPSYKLSIGSNTTGIHNPSVNSLSFVTDDVERMRISSTGNIGIGTDAPAELIHLRNNSGDAGIRIQSSNVSDIGFYSSSGYVAAIGINVSQGHLYLYNGGNVSVKNGRLGIGNIDPGQKLDITGGNGRVESGYSWLTNSDIRYKQNITTLDNSLEKILNIRGVRYDLKNDKQIKKGNGKHIGFIAQELEKEFPEFVVTEENGYKSVSYDKMTAVLVEAMKEQQTQIDELKKLVIEQQSQISALLKSERNNALSMEEK